MIRLLLAENKVSILVSGCLKIWLLEIRVSRFCGPELCRREYAMSIGHLLRTLLSLKCVMGLLVISFKHATQIVFPSNKWEYASATSAHSAILKVKELRKTEWGRVRESENPRST
jgi:hypothetical protein